MNIQIFLFGIYRNWVAEYDPEVGTVLTIEKDLSKVDLLNILGIKSDAAVVFVNNKVFGINNANTINEDDIIKIFPPVYGG